MSWKCLPYWKIPNDNFYPIAMACIADEKQQTPTVVIASEEHVFFLPVLNINRAFNEQQLFTRCDLELNAPISALKTTATQVFLVSSDGHLMVNEYADKKFTNLVTYNRVLHVECGSKKGELFLVRQKESSGQLVLEVIDGSKRFSSHVTSKCYELVVENIDVTARFSIKSFVVNETNERFTSDFLSFTKLTIGEQILLVAINNSIYMLQEQDTGESDLITVRCFASCVIDFEFSEANLCLTVLLQSGALIIFGHTVAPEVLTVPATTIYLPVPIEAYAFEKESNAFLYSDGNGIHRVHYYFSEETNQIVTERKEIPIRGVIAITLLESKAVALLLTDNNQFYTIDNTDRKQTTVADVPKMFTLGKGRQTSSKRMTSRLTEEVHFDKRLDEAIQAEQAKFNVLALYSNRSVFERLARAAITFHRNMPPRKGKTLWIGNHKDAACLFASVKVEINLGFFIHLSNQKRWNIYIEYNERFVTYPVHDTFTSEGVLNGILAFSKRALVNGIPTFRCMLVTTVKHGNERLLLSIPIPVSVPPVEECAAHFVQNAPSSLISIDGSNVSSAASDIVAQNNPHPARWQRHDERIITYCIRNEQSKAKAVSFSNFLENNTYDTWCALDASITVSWHGGRAATCLKTNCPVAMDMVKRFLLDNDEYNAEIEQRRDKLKGLFLELQAVTDGELIVKLYRKVRNHGIVDDDDDVLSHVPR